MKAEHRKELETNTLANTLGKLIENTKQGISRNTVLIFGVIVLVVVLFYTWRYFAGLSQGRSAVLWLKWDQLGDPDELDKANKEVLKQDDEKKKFPSSLADRPERALLLRLETFAKENPGTMQGRLAHFEEARLALYQGLRFLDNINSSGKEQARDRLKTAADLYKKLEGETRDLPLLRQEALLNAGKALESLGNLDEAQVYYTKLEKEYPKTDYGKTGSDELERLKTDKDTIDYLNKELKPPPEPKLP